MFVRQTFTRVKPRAKPGTSASLKNKEDAEAESKGVRIRDSKSTEEVKQLDAEQGTDSKVEEKLDAEQGTDSKVEEKLDAEQGTDSKVEEKLDVEECTDSKVEEKITDPKDWLNEGLVDRVNENPPEVKGYYFPDRPVFGSESKTMPIRPVFDDASCRGHNGLALKRHERLVFGLNCSPFLLNAVMEYHLQEIKGSQVKIAKMLARSLYMDNCIASMETKQEVQEFQRSAIEIMEKTRMNLREWEFSFDDNSSEQPFTKVLGVDCSDWLLTRRSDYSLNIRIMAYVMRFIGKLKRQSTEAGPLKVEELNFAEKKLVTMIQEIVSIEKSSSIKSLKIFKNSEGLWCVESKLLHGQVPEEFKTPAVLPGDHPFVEQLIWEMHRGNGHAGVQFILSILREKFWIIRGRKTIGKIINRCIICKRFKEKSLQRPMAALPESRIGLGKPFQTTGVDLLGPLYMKDGGKEAVSRVASGQGSCLTRQVAKEAVSRVASGQGSCLPRQVVKEAVSRVASGQGTCLPRQVAKEAVSRVASGQGSCLPSSKWSRKLSHKTSGQGSCLSSSKWSRKLSPKTSGQGSYLTETSGQGSCFPTSAETAVQREHRLRINRERASTSRAAESVGQRENRLRKNINRVSTSRAAETPQEHTARILNVRERTLAPRNSQLITHLNPYAEITRTREIARSRTQNKHKKDKETFDKQHRTPHFEVNDLVLVENYRHPDTDSLYLEGVFIRLPLRVSFGNSNRTPGLDGCGLLEGPIGSSLLADRKRERAKMEEQTDHSNETTKQSLPPTRDDILGGNAVPRDLRRPANTDRQRREQTDHPNDTAENPTRHGNRAAMWPKPCDKFSTFDLTTIQCSRRQTAINVGETTSFNKPCMERFPRQQENNQRSSVLTELSSKL
ncbi:hypothetical protein LAZ67_22000718 [Cordylochernes scorpioides]|uniref:Integrase zinc-binding domain-containing protein n=1 Tax=Cordylochernes scorpioides TaxID=51811 RepID=A0ABY6LNQ8_9ARAC|nr:hypothetical protein LAZ67_22000718 [Cordylochernes scorpioides]